VIDDVEAFPGEEVGGGSDGGSRVSLEDNEVVAFEAESKEETACRMAIVRMVLALVVEH
jgi:hypothetical protein